MRNSEIVLAVVNILLLGLAVRGKSFGKIGTVIGVAASLSVMLAHIRWEGARWEMIPLYLLTLLPIVVGLKAARRKKSVGKPRKRKSRRLLIGLSALFYAAGSVALPTALPVFAFEPPEGAYGVGTVQYAWTDGSRPQVHAADDSDKRRELLVRFWYPTDHDSSEEPVPYLEHPRVFAQAFGSHEGVPSLLFDSLRLVGTHSRADAPLSSAQPEYPVVIYSHGNRGWNGQSTFLTEQLASRGYIVIGIEHAGGTNATVFPDGEIMPFYADAGQKLDNGAFDRLVDGVWVPDLKFVLDRLEQINDAVGDADFEAAAEKFAGRLDTGRIGIVGYSMGGAAAVQLLLSDERLKAGIDMDGGFYGSLRADEGIDRPFMLMSADRTFRPDGMNDEQLAAIGASRQDYDETIGELLQRQARAADGGNYILTLRGADHSSFSDAPLYSPLLSAASGLDARGTHRIVRKYAEAFFDTYLKKDSSASSVLVEGSGEGYAMKKGN